MSLFLSPGPPPALLITSSPFTPLPSPPAPLPAAASFLFTLTFRSIISLSSPLFQVYIYLGEEGERGSKGTWGAGEQGVEDVDIISAGGLRMPTCWCLRHEGLAAHRLNYRCSEVGQEHELPLGGATKASTSFLSLPLHLSKPRKVAGNTLTPTTVYVLVASFHSYFLSLSSSRSRNPIIFRITPGSRLT